MLSSGAVAIASDWPTKPVRVIVSYAAGGANDLLGRVFAEAIGRADRLEVTELDIAVDGDATAPDRTAWRTAALDPPQGWRTSPGGIRYRFRTLLPPAVPDVTGVGRTR